MKNDYVTAVYDLIVQDTDIATVLSGLNKTLKENGHSSLHAQILNSVISKLEQEHKASSTFLTVAKETDVQKLQQTITTSLQKIGGSLEHAIITIDQTLVGGYVATHNGISIDASHKGKLVQLYRNITT